MLGIWSCVNSLFQKCCTDCHFQNHGFWLIVSPGGNEMVHKYLYWVEPCAFRTKRNLTCTQPIWSPHYTISVDWIVSEITVWTLVTAKAVGLPCFSVRKWWVSDDNRRGFSSVEYRDFVSAVTAAARPWSRLCYWSALQVDLAPIHLLTQKQVVWAVLMAISLTSWYVCSLCRDCWYIPL